MQEKLTCCDCCFYHEKTTGTGYCSEWDTMVDYDDICIYEFELVTVHNKENTNRECISDDEQI